MVWYFIVTVYKLSYFFCVLNWTNCTLWRMPYLGCVSSPQVPRSRPAEVAPARPCRSLPRSSRRRWRRRTGCRSSRSKSSRRHPRLQLFCQLFLQTPPDLVEIHVYWEILGTTINGDDWNTALLFLSVVKRRIKQETPPAPQTIVESSGQLLDGEKLEWGRHNYLHVNLINMFIHIAQYIVNICLHISTFGIYLVLRASWIQR